MKEGNRMQNSVMEQTTHLLNCLEANMAEAVKLQGRLRVDRSALQNRHGAKIYMDLQGSLLY